MTPVGNVDRKGLRAVERLIDAGVCRSACYHESTASTNTLALDELRAGQVTDDQLPRLYLADDQTAGRGRHGRSWNSDGGTLTFSVTVDWDWGRPDESKLLSLSVGVGLARAIEFAFAPLMVRLKWPNDVYLDGGKAAGVLIETSQTARDRVVIGVGVNVSRAPEVSELPDPATASPTRSISQVTGRHVSRYEILEGLVTETLAATGQLSENGGEIVEEFRKRCHLTGRRVSYLRGAVELEGECAGVTESGELEISTEEGPVRLQSGEARLVRIRH